MEKRLLIAAALSFLILFGWNAFIAPPPKPQQVDEKQQHIENNNLTDLNSSEKLKSTNIDFVEEKYLWKTERFDLEFTNRGGNIDKIILTPHEQVVPIHNLLSLAFLDNKEFFLKESSKNKIVYRYEENEAYVEKEYRLDDKSGLLHIDISGNGLENERKLTAYRIDMSILRASFLEKESNKPDQKEQETQFNTEKPLFEYVVNSDGQIFRRAKAFEFVSKKNDHTLGGANEWVGFRNRYYCLIIKPEFQTNQTNIETLSKDGLRIYWDVSRETSKNTAHFSATVYLGPEDKGILKSFGLGFEKIKRFYNWAIFEWPAKFIYYILHGIHKFIPIWGLCIILISLIVYLATYPLTLKSMKSMRKMQQIQPEIAALRDKYKDNPQQMNAEMMAIYHRYNINPMSGCLPMILQMPIFIGLYQVLWRDVSFKGQKFLWIQDLSEPDRLIVFSKKLPLIGQDLNFLPLLMVVIMFVQQKLNLKSAIVTDETQLMQQKMMMYVMPVLLGVIFYKFSSGLTLYFVLFYAMSTLTQWKMNASVSTEKP